MMKTRLVDIAREAGVSKATVSRALSDSPLVREETKRRIQCIARERHYQPNALAQAVATKRSGILGFCLYKKDFPYFGHTFFGPVLDGAIATSRARGYHLVLACSNDEADTFDEHFIQDSIDGAILVTTVPGDAVRAFRRRRIQPVLLNSAFDETCPCIVDDNCGGTRKLLEHLIARGHRRIAILLECLEHESYLLRYLSYLDTLEAHGIAPYHNPALCPPLPSGRAPVPESTLMLYGIRPRPIAGTPLIAGHLHPSYGREAVRGMLQTGNLPTAIFATTDTLAIGAVQALREAGLRVPQDIAVAGYDDIDMAEACWPPLTTVRVNRQRMGELTVETLLAQIAGQREAGGMQVVPNELIIRQST